MLARAGAIQSPIRMAGSESAVSALT